MWGEGERKTKESEGERENARKIERVSDVSHDSTRPPVLFGDLELTGTMLCYFV